MRCAPVGWRSLGRDDALDQVPQPKRGPGKDRQQGDRCAVGQQRERREALSDAASHGQNRACPHQHRATDLALKTITTGVTDASILSVLWTLNVDFIQGEFLQAPQRELDYDFSSMQSIPAI